MLCSVVLVLAVGEGFFRLRVRAERKRFLGSRDPATLATRAAPAGLVYDFKPGHPGTTNSAGLRDVEHDRAKAPGVFRIAVIGDSVSTMGPLEELYLRRLQHRFDEALPGAVEILNFAVPGYDVEQSVEMLETRTLAWEPDLVLWQFHDNDGWPSVYLPGLGTYYYRPASYLLREIREKLVHYRCMNAISAEEPHAVRPDQRYLRCRMEEVAEKLRQAAAILQERDIRLYVFLYPTWPIDDDWSNYSPVGDALHDELSARFTAAGADVLDLVPVLRSHDSAALRASADDPWHPNAEGHRILAEALFPPLREIVESSGRP